MGDGPSDGGGGKLRCDTGVLPWFCPGFVWWPKGGREAHHLRGLRACMVAAANMRLLKRLADAGVPLAAGTLIVVSASSGHAPFRQTRSRPPARAGPGLLHTKGAFLCELTPICIC
jgi:hypothetical protein